MVNGLIILFGLTMLYLSTTSRLKTHVNTLVIQGLLLFLICATDFSHHPWYTIIFLTIETLIVKAILIPIFLNKVLKKTHSNRDTDANIAHFYCLLISSVILFGGFMLGVVNIPSLSMINPVCFGIALSTIIISLWLITIKHKILSNVIEFITMENGIFLLSISVAKEMPMLVNIGVLLDVFIAIYILGLFVSQINKELGDMEVAHLSDLKDCEYDD
jgi:hydrogenase-4 component E